MDSPRPCVPGAGLAPLRRLTRTQYNNTVRDLLGFDSGVASGFSSDEKVGAFDANVSSPVSEPALEDYLRAAEQLAGHVVSDPKLLAGVVGCEPANAACGRMFIERFGLRAYRRPLAAAEIDRLLKGPWALGSMRGDSTLAVKLTLQAMLSSHHFLYLMEDGKDEASLRALDDYELASRLSYFLWASMPDAALFEAARTGALASPAGLAAQVQRMLADDRARVAIRDFHLQWAGVAKLLDRNQFDGAVGASAHGEIAQLVDEVIWRGQGKLPQLFTTRVSFVDAPLATLYGAPKPASGTARVELNAQQRSGLLTRIGPLVAHTNPSARGKFIRADLLCQAVPPPPPGVDTNLPPPEPNQSPRQRWEKHVNDPTCGNCHRLMDPLGFALEHYDTTGKYRTMDGAFPVDARGEIVGTEASDGPVDGALALSERLSSARELAACAAHEMTTFALGRVIRDEDRCLIDTATEALRGSGLDVKALMTAIARAQGFQMRRVAP